MFVASEVRWKLSILVAISASVMEGVWSASMPMAAMKASLLRAHPDAAGRDVELSEGGGVDLAGPRDDLKVNFDRIEVWWLVDLGRRSHGGRLLLASREGN
ncbi:hypothetical protein T484DRAFT_1759799 [Baffinella frigidus]|nr:hypothetical protein T484DRAFT_1759799 [Cryptophyta sp. CCMP2293]